LAHAHRDFNNADNMTIEVGAVASILSVDNPEVDDMLEEFYRRHSSDHLLVDKWFMLRAARAPSASVIKDLTSHSEFTYKTPNRVYSLIGGFTGSNLQGFHAVDGSGYRLLAETICTLNTINPQVAARMANSFRSWGRYDDARKSQAAAAMRKILHHKGLSNDVFEIITRTLDD
jgi:aminopeptidase N